MIRLTLVKQGGGVVSTPTTILANEDTVSNGFNWGNWVVPYDGILELDMWIPSGLSDGHTPDGGWAINGQRVFYGWWSPYKPRCIMGILVNAGDTLNSYYVRNVIHSIKLIDFNASEWTRGVPNSWNDVWWTMNKAQIDATGRVYTRNGYMN